MPETITPRQYVARLSDHFGPTEWAVGFYQPDGTFKPTADGIPNLILAHAICADTQEAYDNQ